MKNLFLLFALLMIATTSFGQVSYEKGYFVDDSGKKTDCLIRNVDKLTNPVNFFYKITAEGDVKTGTIDSVQEFGIDRFSRFIRATVQIDLSGSNLDDLSKDKSPIWSQEQLFLNVLVEGKVTLYLYVKGSMTRFFYSVSDSSIHQLVYKEYLVEKDVIAENNTFRQQLWANVKCPNTKMSTVARIKYNQKDLEPYFKSVNNYLGDTVNEYVLKPRKVLWNLKVVSGVDLTNLYIISRFNNLNDFSSKYETGYCFGLESEFILPFNRNKWSLFIQPTYQYFHSEKTRMSFNYRFIEFPIGLRYYSFINRDIKLFFNGIANTNISVDFNSKFTYTRWVNEHWATNTKGINPVLNYALGGGVEFKRLSFELRYSGNRGVFNESVFWPSDYTRCSFMLGYKLFKH